MFLAKTRLIFPVARREHGQDLEVFFVAPTAFPGAEEGSLSWGEGVPSGGVSMAEGAVVMPVPSNHVRIVCLSCTLSRFVAATANSLLSHYCFQ